MSDRTELLAAVLADPACDAKRLIYADWLEDHGEGERAAFIRNSIAHAKRSGPMDARATALWLEHREEWFLKYDGLDRVDLFETHQTPSTRGIMIATLSRGFISALRGPLAALLEHGPAIVREHPVERVEVTDANDNYFVQPRFGQDTTNAAVLAELRRRAAQPSLPAIV